VVKDSPPFHPALDYELLDAPPHRSSVPVLPQPLKHCRVQKTRQRTLTPFGGKHIRAKVFLAVFDFENV